MRQIRLNTFETNSSSTHTLVIVSKEEWEKFKNGELFWDDWEEKLVEPKEKEEYEDDEDDEDYRRYLDYAGYWERIDEMEDFLYEHRTKGGEEIVVFGYHGYDG